MEFEADGVEEATAAEGEEEDGEDGEALAAILSDVDAGMVLASAVVAVVVAGITTSAPSPRPA